MQPVLHLLVCFATFNNPCVMQSGVQRRAFCAVNEQCSRKGPVWQTNKCILMQPVFQVPSRGTNLQESFQSDATPAPTSGPAVEVDLRGVDWLGYNGGFSFVTGAKVSVAESCPQSIRPPAMCFQNNSL